MKNKEKLGGLTTTALTTAIVLAHSVANPAFAQIEEVVVTAQKRAQSAQDIGVAVSAYSAQDINNLGLDKPAELGAHTPGLSTANATSGGTPIFAIRGIGLDDFNINNSSGVGVYVDEVFASSPMLLGFRLLDIERVEVLKGPQGTLYGKNTTGGAINFVGNKPTDEFEASISAGVSRWERVDTEGYLNGALTEDVNARVAFSYAKQNKGWQRDIDTGEELGKADKFSIVSKFGISINDETDVLINLHYGKDKSKPQSPQNDDSEIRANDTLFLGGLFDGKLDVPADSVSVRVGDLKIQRDEEGYGGAVTVNHDINFATLISI